MTRGAASAAGDGEGDDGEQAEEPGEEGAHGGEDRRPGGAAGLEEGRAERNDRQAKRRLLAVKRFRTARVSERAKHDAGLGPAPRLTPSCRA